MATTMAPVEELTAQDITEQVEEAWGEAQRLEIGELGEGNELLHKGLFREAFYAVDRYRPSEGWDTSEKAIDELSERMVHAAIPKIRELYTAMAAEELAGIRRLTPVEGKVPA
jgi:hypothetical protein